MRVRSLRRRVQDESGQALVELSLVVVLLFMLVMGVVETGRIGSAYLAVMHASREGARVGALGRSDAEIFTTVRDAAGALERNRVQIAVTPVPAQRRRGDPLTVQVDYGVELFAPVVSSLLPNPFPVRGRTVMRIE